MESDYRFAGWFLRNWSRAGLPTAVILLLLSPFLIESLHFEGFLVFLLLPVYMLHQYEEHAHGRFKADVERMLPPKLGPVSNTVIFYVNIGLVWGLFLGVLYLVHYVNLALGLIAAYATLLNGLLHIVMALRNRRYNGGLWTAIVLFVPVGGYAAYTISQASQASAGYQLLGIGLAVLAHIVTFASVIESARRAGGVAKLVRESGRGV